MILYTETPSYDNFIAHYGVKGMKWGKRNINPHIDLGHYRSKMDPEALKAWEERNGEKKETTKSTTSTSSTSKSSGKKSGSSSKKKTSSSKKSSSSGSKKSAASSEKKEKASSGGKAAKEPKEKAAKEPKETTSKSEESSKVNSQMGEILRKYNKTLEAKLRQKTQRGDSQMELIKTKKFDREEINKMLRHRIMRGARNG